MRIESLIRHNPSDAAVRADWEGDTKRAVQAAKVARAKSLFGFVPASVRAVTANTPRGRALAWFALAGVVAGVALFAVAFGF